MTVPAVPVELLTGLNDAQARAVTFGDGPLLIVAGPGSGKTKTVTHRIAGLLARGVPPSAMLAVTFTNKAAEEMRTRLAGLVGDGQPLPPVSTFHAACVKILRRFPAEAGLPPRFGIADSDDATRLVTRAMKEAGLSVDNGEGRRVASRISWAKNRQVTYASAFADWPDGETLERVAVRYGELLAEAGLVDFDDLLSRTRDVLVNNADVAHFYQSRLRYVCVDEFQDTNPVQYDIALALAAGGSLCVVGDMAQSIYSFRASDPGIVGRFRREHPDVTVIELQENYRSTGAIVALATEIIAGDATDTVISRSMGEQGVPPVAVVAADDHAEAGWAATWVADQPGDAAILVRTNAQTRAFEDALTRAGVPHQVVGTLRFWDRAEVKDALAWLRVVVNPADRLAFERACGAPSRGIGPAALAALNTVAEQHHHADLPSALTAALNGEATLPGRAVGPFTSFAASLAQVRAAAVRGPKAALAEIVAGTGLRESWGKGAEAKERLENLAELTRVADGWAATFDGCRAFLESVALAGASDAEGSDAQVVIMTVHAAKGREWDNVVVAGVEDGFFPHGRVTSAAELAEERRLLYVAVTRARHRLALTRTFRRFRFGRWMDVTASPLVAGIPPDRLTWVALTPRTGHAGVGGATAQGRLRSSRTPGRGSSRPAASRTSPGRRPTASSWTPGTPTSRPAATGPRLDPATVHVGEQVIHSTFGNGTVTRLDGSRATIAFTGGERILDLAFAPLTRP